MKGLGAALIQDANQSLSPENPFIEVEERYVNIEREFLAFIYDCEKFYTYLYGRSFTVHTDHKSPESVHLKHLTAAPSRLQLMLLGMQPYDFTIHYQPRKKITIANTLSRHSTVVQDPIRDR